MAKSKNSPRSSMARRIQRIANHRDPVKVETAFSARVRAEAESLLQRKLPPELWQELENATQVCVTLAQKETSSANAATVLRNLESVTSAIQTLQLSIGAESKPARNWDGPAHVHHVFLKNYQFQKGVPGASFALLAHLLEAVLAISSVIDEGLQYGDQDKLALAEGTWWDTWIWYITQSFRKMKIPVGVRKDSDKQVSDTQASPFVKFIEVIQKALPEDFRRSNQSRNALAQSISRARKRFSVPGQI